MTSITPKTYVCYRAAEPLKIDGHLTEGIDRHCDQMKPIDHSLAGTSQAPDERAVMEAPHIRR